MSQGVIKIIVEKTWKQNFVRKTTIYFVRKPAAENIVNIKTCKTSTFIANVASETIDA